MSGTARVPAVITGIGCRLPGGIRGPRDLWTALRERRCVISTFAPERWAEMTGRLHPEQRPEHPWPAGVLDDLDAFDAGYFGIGDFESAEMDPQQRILLEVVVEALQDAGVPPSSLAGSRTGVYVGAAAIDRMAQAFAPGVRANMYSAGGTAMSIQANRLSYALDLRGPSHTLDSACSSSMVALHQARRDLESGDIDMAIVGGASVMLAPALTAAFVDGGVLSSRGELRPFDADGDGYLRSEGMAAMVLARADAALERSDRVYATIAGTAENSDGRSNGLFAPNRAAQEELLRLACASAGIDTASVDYVEAHGTSTMIGDVVEATALASVLGEGRTGPLPIGTGKANFGHLEGAAGVVAVIKTALALHHGVIPATINHDRLRPELGRIPVEVVTRARDWPVRGERRVAGVSAFGFGGANAHTILTAPREPRHHPSPVGTRSRLVPISAHSDRALRATASEWATVAGTASLDAVSGTAMHRRDHATHRAAVAATDPGQAEAALRALAEGSPHGSVRGPRAAPRHSPRTVFVFPGHGAQWKRMGAVLSQCEPVFAAAERETREALAAHGGTSWSPGEPMRDFAAMQQATFTMQVALAALWRSWGIVPAGVIGHSLGEAAAAHVAGALSLDDAARLVCARSALLAESAPKGGMVAAEIPPERAAGLVADHPNDLAVAAHNGARAAVISGSHDALTDLQAVLERDGTWAARVTDGVPAHGPLLEPMLPQLRAALAGLEPKDTDITIASTHTGGAIAGSDLDAGYWTRQLRDTVRFAPALAGLTAEPSLFVEIAPRGVLGHAIVEAIDEAGTMCALAGAARPDRDGEPDEHLALLAQAGEVYTYGPVPAGVAPSGLPPASLPPNAWDYGPRVTGTSAPDLATSLDTAGTPAQRRAAITAAVAAVVAAALRLPTEHVDTDSRFEDLGLTSVALIEIRTRVQGLHSALPRVTAADVATHPTIGTLAALVDERVPQTIPVEGGR